MTFTQKELLFSHNMISRSEANQPAMFRIEINDLIQPGEPYSSLFVIERVNLRAYKRGTWGRIPVQFAIVDEKKKRVLTNEPSKLSSAWTVPFGDGKSRIKIAGTDEEPFTRVVPVADPENRIALVNVFGFMLSSSLWTADDASGAFEIVIQSTREDFQFSCKLCSEKRRAYLVKGAGMKHVFNFPSCNDGCVCVPAQNPSADQEHLALGHLLDLLRTASNENLAVLTTVMREMLLSDRSFEDLQCSRFPPTRLHNGDIVLPYELMKYVTFFYRSMSEYVDNFAIVDPSTSTLRVLIQSPSEEVGLVTGKISFTLIHGSVLRSLYTDLLSELQTEDESDELQQSYPVISQLSPEVLWTRYLLGFRSTNSMSVRDWLVYYYS